MSEKIKNNKKKFDFLKWKIARKHAQTQWSLIALCYPFINEMNFVSLLWRTYDMVDKIRSSNLATFLRQMRQCNKIQFTSLIKTRLQPYHTQLLLSQAIDKYYWNVKSSRLLWISNCQLKFVERNLENQMESNCREKETSKLVSMCIEAATESAAAVETWRRQRRTLERMPSHLADALLHRLLRRRLLFPSLLE